jgi:hypothetical protein
MAALLFRFYFGLHCPSPVGEDDLQSYLIGLKAFTTGTWPFYGPDMMTFTSYQGQMCGALEGLLISIPLHLWPIPEAPYLFLNLLTLSALSFLGWYICRRLPKLSPWFVFTWLFIAPWTTHYSTQVINPSYAVVGAILFTVGFMESVPALSMGLLSAPLANVLMGFGLAWTMQLHMSWTMFAPLWAFSLFSQRKKWVTAIGYGLLGILPMAALILPTYWVYGFGLGRDIHAFSTAFNPENLFQLVNIIARFLSFSSFELPIFLGQHSHERWDYLFSTPLLLLPGVFLYIAGILQAILLLIGGFANIDNPSQWKAVKLTTLGLVLVIYVFFWFSMVAPASQRYYEALPFAMVYAFYVWNSLAGKRFWRILGVVFLVCGTYFQMGYALKTDFKGNSVYSQNRIRMKEAIDHKDYRLLAERRVGSLY